MKKITWRWLLNSFGVIVVIILAVELIFAYSISSYYYNAVRQTLRSRATLVNSIFSQYHNEGASFENQVRDYVASFSQKERMELMVINRDGSVTFTSSGFEPDQERGLADYSLALASEEGYGEQLIGGSGARILSMSFLTDVQSDPAVSAVRFMVSMDNVDRQILFWIVSMALLGVAVLLMVLFSSSYFIGTIVNPVGEVGRIARRIADGDFNARLEKKHNDEVGDLCDTINYMAGKLGEAERIKNDFISSVSHELRTPLTAIQGWAETLLDDDGGDRDILRRGMSIIISETTRLSGMVEELLDFSRMQSGWLKLEMGSVDALAELSDVVLMYAERAKRDGILLTYSDNDLIVPIIGDKNRLRQVFVNIVDNAVKYSDPGGAIHVTARAGQSGILIVVQDNGIGIGPDDLPKVKEKFYKADSTRRSSGIGLAVADEIITRHGGSLNIQSEYGKGTKVTVRLQVKPADKAGG